MNASGLLHGVKIGTTTVIITVTGGEEPVSIEVTVNVVDVISGIQFSQDSVNLDPGTSLNGQVLADKGITAKFIWASGKVEGDVDLSKATFIGYDPDATGEQEVTVRLVQDGVSVTGTIIVNVGGGGCNSSVLSNGYIFGAIGVSLLCVALIFVRRKSE